VSPAIIITRWGRIPRFRWLVEPELLSSLFILYLKCRLQLNTEKQLKKVFLSFSQLDLNLLFQHELGVFLVCRCRKLPLYLRIAIVSMYFDKNERLARYVKRKARKDVRGALREDEKHVVTLISLARRFKTRFYTLKNEPYSRSAQFIVSMGGYARSQLRDKIRSDTITNYEKKQHEENVFLFALSDLNLLKHQSHFNFLINAAILISKQQVGSHCVLLLTGESTFQGINGPVGIVSNEEFNYIQSEWSSYISSGEVISFCREYDVVRNDIHKKVLDRISEINPTYIFCMGGLFRSDMVGILLSRKFPMIMLTAQVNNYVPWWVDGVMPRSETHRQMMLNAGVSDSRILKTKIHPASERSFKKFEQEKLGREYFSLPVGKFLIVTAVRGRLKSLFLRLEQEDRSMFYEWLSSLDDVVWVVVGCPELRGVLEEDDKYVKLLLASKILVLPFINEFSQFLLEADCVLGFPRVTGGGAPFSVACLARIPAVAYINSDGASRVSSHSHFKTLADATVLIDRIRKDKEFRSAIVEESFTMASSEGAEEVYTEWFRELSRVRSNKHLSLD
jgi:hypothetical protein